MSIYELFHKKVNALQNLMLPPAKNLRGTKEIISDIFYLKLALYGTFYLKAVLGWPHRKFNA